MYIARQRATYTLSSTLHSITLIISTAITTTTTTTTTTTSTTTFRKEKKKNRRRKTKEKQKEEGQGDFFLILRTKKKIHIRHNINLKASGFQRIYAIIQETMTPRSYFRSLIATSSGVVFSLCPRCLHVFQYWCSQQRLRQHGSTGCVGCWRACRSFLAILGWCFKDRHVFASVKCVPAWRDRDRFFQVWELFSWCRVSWVSQWCPRVWTTCRGVIFNTHSSPGSSLAV